MYQHNWERPSECMGHMFLLALQDEIDLKAGIHRCPPRFRERVGTTWRSWGWSPLPDKYKRYYDGRHVLVTTKEYLQRPPDGNETGELGGGSNEPENTGTKFPPESNESITQRSGEGVESCKGETAP